MAAVRIAGSLLSRNGTTSAASSGVPCERRSNNDASTSAGALACAKRERASAADCSRGITLSLGPSSRGGNAPSTTICAAASSAAARARCESLACKSALRGAAAVTDGADVDDKSAELTRTRPSPCTSSSTTPSRSMATLQRASYTMNDLPGPARRRHFSMWAVPTRLLGARASKDAASDCGNEAAMSLSSSSVRASVPASMSTIEGSTLTGPTVTPRKGATRKVSRPLTSTCVQPVTASAAMVNREATAQRTSTC